MTRSRRSLETGFSVIELLISVALLGILLAVGAAMMRSASDAYQTTSAVTTTQERLDAVTQIVRYDLRLAGYTGAAGGELLGGGNAYDWTPGTKTLVVRYNEDRYSDAGSSLAVTYVLDGTVLTRQVSTTAGAGATNDLLEDVSNFDVVVDTDADDVAQGLRLQLSFTDGRSVPIAARFVNPQE